MGLGPPKPPKANSFKDGVMMGENVLWRRRRTNESSLFKLCKLGRTHSYAREFVPSCLFFERAREQSRYIQVCTEQRVIDHLRPLDLRPLAHIVSSSS